MAADPVRKTYWVYTDQSLFELVIGNEDRDIWKIYLEKGQFDVSLKYAKVTHLSSCVFQYAHIDQDCFTTRLCALCSSEYLFQRWSFLPGCTVLRTMLDNIRRGRTQVP